MCCVILLFLSLNIYMSSLFIIIYAHNESISGFFSEQPIFFFKNTALISIGALFEILGFVLYVLITYLHLLLHRLINLSSENIANNSNFFYFF